MKTVGIDGKPAGVLVAFINRNGTISDYSDRTCVRDGIAMTFKEAKERGYLPVRSASGNRRFY